MRQAHPGAIVNESFDEWERLIENAETPAGLEHLLRTLGADTSEHAALLRQNGPFAGLLSEDERRRAYENADTLEILDASRTA